METTDTVDALPEAVRQRSPSMHAVIYKNAQGAVEVQELGTQTECLSFVRQLDPSQVLKIYKVSKVITPQVKTVVHF